MAIKRSKTNKKFFDDIPKKEDKKTLAYDKSKALANMISQRNYLNAQYREIFKKKYNLSVEIHRLEQEIAELFCVMNHDQVNTDGCEEIVLGAEDRLGIP